jgi:hypothetical protein
MDETEMDKFNKIMEINVTGVMHGLKYGTQSMKKNKVEEWKSIIMTRYVPNLIFQYALSGLMFGLPAPSPA